MFETYKTYLQELVALRSVSADPSCRPELQKTAEYFQRLFEAHGFSVKLLSDGVCNPVVVARYDAGRPETTLVYGHYDVQPAELEQGWKTDPFVLTEADGRFYGRGSVDNKGQTLIHIVSVFELIKEKRLRSNVTFMLEGDEETANPGLGALMDANRELFKCDEIIISDGEMRAGQPTIEASLRGGYNLRLQLKTGQNDLHSGIAGGAVPNAAAELTKLLNRLTDDRGHVTVPGFYDGMAPVDPERADINATLAAKFDLSERYGVQQLLSANGVDFYTQTGLYPTLQITGLASGYTGSGFANIVPGAAEARINVRLVVGQDPTASAALVQDYLMSNKPDYAELKLTVAAPHPAIAIDTTSPAHRRAAELLAQAYEADVVYSNVGGAVPVVADFKEILGIDALMMPLGNEDCNMHGANENFRLDLIEKGLAFSKLWFAL